MTDDYKAGRDQFVNNQSVQVVNVSGRAEIRFPDGRVVSIGVFAGVPPYPPLFVGRATLIAELQAALLSGASVSLSTHGLGGVGKTTLATALAYDVTLLNRFSGILWAQLGPHPDLDSILNGWGEALGLSLREVFTIEAKLEALQRAIGRQPLLIILDDVWDMRLGKLLRRAGGAACCYLLTTRSEAIARDFAPTSCRDVAELSPAAAVEMLTALCPPAAARPDLLGELAAACGNLPLALKLIGGYLASKITFPRQVERVVGELKRSPLWLSLSDGDSTAEQVLTLSLDALPDDAHRAAFLRLAAFAPKPASFSLDAACAVANANDDMMTTLLQRHLLEQLPDNPERLTLHQTLHALATARCPDLPTARRAHADFYLKLMNADHYDWQSIEAEWEQIQYAWVWVSNTSEAEDLVLPYIWATRQFMEMRGYWREKVAWTERGLSAARAAGNHQEEASLLHNLGTVYSALGDKQRALDYLQQALPIRRQVGDRAGEATTLNNIGRVYSDLGDKQRALDYYQQALPILRQVGDRASEATALNNIGGGYNELGDKQQALTYYQQALPIQRQVGDRSGEAVTRFNVAMIYYNRGEYAAAIVELEQVVVIDEAIQHPDLASDRATLEDTRRLLSGG